MMGVICLVLGYSGSGKSSSLRNFEPGEIGIFNIAGKRLPFRKDLKPISKIKDRRIGYEDIKKSLKANKLKAYCCDDSNYLMAFENFSKAHQTGYGKFTDIAVNFEQLLETALDTDDDTIFYLFMHPETDETGRLKPKTVGKMIDNQLTIEGLVPITLYSYKDDSGFHFATESDGTTPVKSPPGMFDSAVIDNDLKLVDSAIREYWGMSPLDGSHE